MIRSYPNIAIRRYPAVVAALNAAGNVVREPGDLELAIRFLAEKLRAIDWLPACDVCGQDGPHEESCSEAPAPYCRYCDTAPCDHRDSAEVVAGGHPGPNGTRCYCPGHSDV